MAATPPRVRRTAGRLAVAMTAVAVALTAAGCSRTGAGGTPAGSGTTTPAAAIKGDIGFNDANLTKLDGALKAALKGKDLSRLNQAMVVNVATDYWNAGRAGFTKGLADLGVKGTYQAPANGRLDQQLSIVQTLRGQGITGLSISAIDPTAVKAPIASAERAGIPVLAIDSPLPKDVGAELYLGTPNYQAGQRAGEAMKQALGGKGQVVVLVGSLTTSNAVERIRGFEDAVKGSGVKVVQKLSDGMDASKALSNAQTAIQTNPEVAGLYGVYSYDGPSAAQAVQAAGKTGRIKIVADDSDAQTLKFVDSGVIQATVLQQPYQQGYTGAFLLTAFKVLGRDATMKIVAPYLEHDGTTLSSGVGLVTKANLADYRALLAKLGIAG
ncbi:substrate-binding domain-containing protein [Streptantibioticus cattleyicolor]|uniref:Sugar ABC transporter, periplasmic sugar-binding protein n=1 Tax=Streptantibioticus cattleyicolor (strain ATCC 35852 / DSM 46488 / JCM 4925 / NBRC 14057 / NRRL 8057) TaxID=1003195 RepID=F8JJB8_STREN|nr:substrate-binding domain-containing protein [Streptantibioticus cattleyicolor]AEW98769.1 sugar ABC transporter, periplasmic sugar-binding protein [Streptantibioticus cattleyicolor NRRL 8057 = DSM 46488]CCB72180.1 Monosaccharide ABC transporter substrate-binding protein, CUT2 family [Streptantibioticus cattleyicolor NRRL 8057 = DSM 46488]